MEFFFTFFFFVQKYFIHQSFECVHILRTKQKMRCRTLAQQATKNVVRLTNRRSIRPTNLQKKLNEVGIFLFAVHKQHKAVSCMNTLRFAKTNVNGPTAAITLYAKLVAKWQLHERTITASYHALSSRLPVNIAHNVADTDICKHPRVKLRKSKSKKKIAIRT